MTWVTRLVAKQEHRCPGTEGRRQSILWDAVGASQSPHTSVSLVSPPLSGLSSHERPGLSPGQSSGADPGLRKPEGYTIWGIFLK